MLSVLIPTYNYNAFFLVKEIHNQLLKENIVFEIICLDDASFSNLNFENDKINNLQYASFKSLDKNLGRSAIRNLLAETANFDWLLFLDADVFPKTNKFIKNYLNLLNNKKSVFCGGLLYQDKPDNAKLLRYKFGKKHEAISVKERKLNAEKYFFTSNFLIEKSAFFHVKFNEKLKKYGREDLLFSINLVEKGYHINHISNEVFHLCLDTNKVFVSKTKKAMENLILIEQEQFSEVKNMPLLKVIYFTKKIKLTKILGKFYPILERLAIKKSSIFYLNCLKISYLCYLKSSYEQN